MDNKKIIEPLVYNFNIKKSGLYAVYISARCESGEDLRIEIDGAYFREIPSKDNIQLFDIPPAFNGSKLCGVKKMIVFVSVLDSGDHGIVFIPKNSAFVENIEVVELAATQDLSLDIENIADDGDRRPWITFVLVDLPLKFLSASITTKWRFRDSDEVKLIIDGRIQKNTFSIFRRNWLWSGSIFKKIFGKETLTQVINSNLPQGVHYIEFWADRTPILHNVLFNLRYTETRAEIHAANLIKEYGFLIKSAATEFDINPIMVGAVVYQEQSTNVNFIDTLTDYVGGLLHLNTSIGIGQVRVKTAEHLEKYFPQLLPQKNNLFLNENVIRIARLKDPLTNIRYVAAKIHFTQNKWKMAGFDIQEKSEILGTLYNIEDIENPVEPHANPEANEFGLGVKANYNKVKNLLDL